MSLLLLERLNMKSVVKNDDFKSFRVRAIEEVVRKMDLIMAIENANKNAEKSDKTWLNKINKKIAELENVEEERPVKVTRRYTNSVIFDKVDKKDTKGTKKLNNKVKPVHNNDKVSDDFINDLIKKIDIRIEELEREEKAKKCSVRHCNSSIFDIKPDDLKCIKVNNEVEKQKCVKIVNENNKLSNSERRAIVFKKWDALEEEESNVKNEIAELKEHLKDISRRKSKVIDELSKIIDERILELEKETVVEEAPKVKNKKLKKSISNKTIKSSEEIKNLGLLRKSVEEILEIDDLKAYRNKNLEEHRNRISTIVHSFSSIKREDPDGELCEEAKKLVMSIADKHKTHRSWCKNLIDYSV